jgi:hypothetical protein
MTFFRTLFLTVPGIIRFVYTIHILYVICTERKEKPLKKQRAHRQAVLRKVNLISVEITHKDFHYVTDRNT